VNGASLIALALLLPAATAVLIPLFSARPNIREGTTLVGAVALFAAVLGLLPDVLNGARAALHVVDILPGLSIAFAVEPLGMLFALVASGLWIVNSLYSVGYMRAEKAPRQTSFYVCFAVAIVGAMGVSLAGNLFTLFLFYEVLTLSTYPLVTHRATPEAIKAGRLYLMMLLGASTFLLLPAIAWTGFAAGTLDFVPGGIVGGKLGDGAMAVLLALFVFGTAKAAVMPLHFWLPAAMVAPTPVSALLHAVAVVKAGVFTVLKVVVYVFGVDTLAAAGAAEWLVYVAGFTVVAASLVALRQDDLKRRLAYSTVSQLSYVVMGAALATTAGVIGSGLQIAMHAAGKITLFFCAGAIAVATHKYKVSELDGIGRAMPVTMTAFLVGSLSIIGLPPLGGMWSKWWLILAGAERGSFFVIAVLIVSSLLNVAYLLPIAVRAFFSGPPGHDGEAKIGLAEAPLACVVPLSLTALLCVVLFFQVGILEGLLLDIAQPATRDGALPDG
jgi:multicomponent Na+:H+ antiporter subunit D